MLHIFLSGFAISFGLIAAIGAQNAFILKQGLLRQHVFLLASLSALSDAILISLGVGGFSVIIDKFPNFIDIARIGGALFLFFYGAKSFYTFLTMSHHLNPSKNKKTALPALLATWAAITWLNPHVYLDTVVLIGAASTHYAPHQLIFAVGAISASFVFFYSLCYGVKFLAPLFKKNITWKLLELVIAIIMWSIAWQLIASH